MRVFLFLILCVPMVGCGQYRQPVESPSSRLQPTYARLDSVNDRARFVGQLVEIEGEVTNTKIMQVLGVDVDVPDDLRKQKIRAQGRLQTWKVQEKEINKYIANRGPGTFYRLENIEYERVPESP